MSHVIVPLLGPSACTLTLVIPRRLATPCQTQACQLSASILAVLAAKWTDGEESDERQLQQRVFGFNTGIQLHRQQELKYLFSCV